MQFQPATWDVHLVDSRFSVQIPTLESLFVVALLVVVVVLAVVALAVVVLVI